MLTIHLEETDCFAAWVSAKEEGMGPAVDGTDAKCESLNIFRICIWSPISHHPPEIRALRNERLEHDLTPFHIIHISLETGIVQKYKVFIQNNLKLYQKFK